MDDANLKPPSNTGWDDADNVSARTALNESTVRALRCLFMLTLSAGDAHMLLLLHVLLIRIWKLLRYVLRKVSGNMHVITRRIQRNDCYLLSASTPEILYGTLCIPASTSLYCSGLSISVNT